MLVAPRIDLACPRRLRAHSAKEMKEFGEFVHEEKITHYRLIWFAGRVTSLQKRRKIKPFLAQSYLVVMESLVALKVSLGPPHSHSACRMSVCDGCNIASLRHFLRENSLSYHFLGIFAHTLAFSLSSLQKHLHKTSISALVSSHHNYHTVLTRTLTAPSVSRCIVYFAHRLHYVFV